MNADTYSPHSSKQKDGSERSKSSRSKLTLIGIGKSYWFATRPSVSASLDAPLMALWVRLVSHERIGLSETGILLYCVETSFHSVTNHHSSSKGSICFIPLVDLVSPRGVSGGILGFAVHSQARNHDRPNRVRHPTDWKFKFSCTPPPLAGKQLLSANALQIKPMKGLTPSRFDALKGARVL